MKTSAFTRLFLLATSLFLASCTSTKRGAAPVSQPAAALTSTATPSGSAPETHLTNTSGDDLDEYAVADISDPLEKLNRATFQFNDKLYQYLLRPVSKGYEKVLPLRVRDGIDNVFDNIRFPARLVNSTLQGKFTRAGKETGKFVVNSIAGIGGIICVSDKMPSLAHVPEEDTGQTLATWGLGHGPYLVLPVYGPSSFREGVGLMGDYALNPINWGVFWSGNHDWTVAVQGTNALRLLPSTLSTYDTTTENAVDPYLSVRSAYIQNRAEAQRQ